MLTSRACSLLILSTAVLCVAGSALGGADTPSGPRLAESPSLRSPSGPVEALFLLETPDAGMCAP